MSRKAVLSLVALVLMGGVLSLGADAPAIDGQIAADEYAFHYFAEEINMDVYWTMTDGDLYVGLRAPASGWVSLGVRKDVPEESTENVMQGVDFVIGYVVDGELSIRDDFADTPFSHQADAELGGTDDVSEAAGSEADGVTIIEFKRPINTDDQFDNPIAQGEAEVYLAYSDADDFVSLHTQRTEAVLNFLTGEGRPED